MSAQQQQGSNQASWPGGTPRNDTPNTPDLSETELRAMHVDELRQLARREGVPGADELRKEQLVDAISQLHRQRRQRGGGQPSTAAGATGAGGRGGGERDREPGSWPGGTPRNDTPNTPDLSETELRAMHVDELRQLARREGVPGADELRKEQLVDAISRLHRQRTRA